MKWKGEENGFGYVWFGERTDALQAMAYCAPKASLEATLPPG
jgi:hypothetical protein